MAACLTRLLPHTPAALAYVPLPASLRLRLDLYHRLDLGYRCDVTRTRERRARRRTKHTRLHRRGRLARITITTRRRHDTHREATIRSRIVNIDTQIVIFGQQLGRCRDEHVPAVPARTQEMRSEPARYIRDRINMTILILINIQTPITVMRHKRIVRLEEKRPPFSEILSQRLRRYAEFHLIRSEEHTSELQ